MPWGTTLGPRVIGADGWPSRLRKAAANPGALTDRSRGSRLAPRRGCRVTAVAPVGLGVIAGCGSWVLLLLMGWAGKIISTNHQNPILVLWKICAVLGLG